MEYVVYAFLGTFYTSEGALLMASVYTLAKECILLKEVNGTQDDVDEILMGYLPDSRSGMCMLRCMQQRVGILVNDTYDVRGAYMFLRTQFPENPFHQNMERGVRFCARIVSKRGAVEMDKCQYAHMVAACIKRRIKYVPGSKAAFYRPFVWKNPNRIITLKPGKKYFEFDRRNLRRTIFEVITKPTRKYTLADLDEVLTSSESRDHDVPVWLPPRPRKGKWKSTDKRKKKKQKEVSKGSDELTSDDISWDNSDKSRRHKDKMFRI